MTVPNRVLEAFADHLVKRIDAITNEQQSVSLDSPDCDHPLEIAWYGSEESVCAVVTATGSTEEWCLHYLFSSPEASRHAKTLPNRPLSPSPVRPNRTSTGFVSEGMVRFSEDKTLEPKLRKLISDEWPESHFAMEKITSEQLGTWLAIRCRPNRLVSHLLATLPPIPEIVALDWKNQVRELESAFMEGRGAIRPDQTWVTPDGKLIPLGMPIERMYTKDRPIALPNRNTLVSATDQIAWPWHVSDARKSVETAASETAASNTNNDRESVLGSPWEAFAHDMPLSMSRSGTRRSASQAKRKGKPQLLTIGIVLLVAFAGMVGFSVLNSTYNSPQVARNDLAEQTPQNPDNNARAMSSVDQASSAGEIAFGRDEKISTDTQSDEEELTSIEDDAMGARSSSMVDDQSLNQLLGQLNLKRPLPSTVLSLEPKPILPGDETLDVETQSPDTIPAITADAIVRGSLQSSDGWNGSAVLNTDTTTDEEMPDEPSGGDSPEKSTSSDETVAKNGAANAADENPMGPRQLNLKFTSSRNKESVAIGSRVVAKNASTTAVLKLPDPLVVEPNATATISGVGFASWKVALEDVDPELVIELHSKPGMRWQVIAMIGVRLQRNAAPIPLGPNDAQLVGNRLLTYSQWLTQSIDSLREARSNRSMRNPRVDYTAQIRLLEAEKRETEDAIKIWEAISRLSHLVYSEQKISVTLHPTSSSAELSNAPSEPIESVNENQ